MQITANIYCVKSTSDKFHTNKIIITFVLLTKLQLQEMCALQVNNYKIYLKMNFNVGCAVLLSFKALNLPLH